MQEKSQIYEIIYALAKPYLNTRKNDIHVESSYRFALQLLKDEPGDPEVVIPAIICHDLGWITLTEELQLKAFGPVFDPDLRRPCAWGCRRSACLDTVRSPAARASSVAPVS